MKNIFAFLRETRGAITIEIALFVPVFVLIFWFTNEVCQSYRMENTMHRATAAIADMLANERLDTEDPKIVFRDILPDSVEPALNIFREMVAPGDPEARIGILVTYFDTTSAGVGAEDKDAKREDAIMFTLQAGVSFPPQGLPDLFAQAEAGLVTEENVAKMELVRVETYYEMKKRPFSLAGYVFPRKYVSDFTAMRKEW